MRWYDLQEAEGSHPARALEYALHNDPLNASLWIRSGIQAELAHNLTLAEQRFLRAAAVSQLYEPRWTLAGFYFRRGREEEFWRWAHLALDRAYGDQRPLFDLAWRIRPDGPYILSQLSRATPRVRRAYLQFLVESGRLREAGPAAESLLGVATAAEAPALRAFVTAALDGRRPEVALRTWNALCSRQLLACDAVDADAGRSISNGRFTRPTLNAGFDWRFLLVDGARLSQNPDAGFLRIEFTGRQPEACDLATQIAPVRPSTAYAILFETQSTGLRAPTGLHWRVADAARGAEIATSTPEWASDTWRGQAATFSSPAETHFIRLTLRYDRLPGTARMAGEALLRAVRLEERR
jgi:hypothetical protein